MRYFIGCVDGAQRVCARMVDIFHIETLMTFDFDPCLVSGLIADRDLGRTRWVFGHKLDDDIELNK